MREYAKHKQIRHLIFHFLILQPKFEISHLKSNLAAKSFVANPCGFELKVLISSRALPRKNDHK